MNIWHKKKQGHPPLSTIRPALKNTASLKMAFCCVTAQYHLMPAYKKNSEKDTAEFKHKTAKKLIYKGFTVP